MGGKKFKVIIMVMVIAFLSISIEVIAFNDNFDSDGKLPR